MQCPFLRRPLAQVGAYLLRFATALLSAQVDAAVLGVKREPGVSARDSMGRGGGRGERGPAPVRWGYVT